MLSGHRTDSHGLNTQGTRPLPRDGCTACRRDGQKAHTRHKGGRAGWGALAFTGVLNRVRRTIIPHGRKSGTGPPVAQGFSPRGFWPYPRNDKISVRNK